MSSAKKNARDAQIRFDDLERIRVSGPTEIANLESQIIQKTNSLAPLKRAEGDIKGAVDAQSGQVQILTNEINNRRNDLNNLLGNFAASVNSIQINANTVRDTQGDLNKGLGEL